MKDRIRDTVSSILPEGIRRAMKNVFFTYDGCFRAEENH